MVSSETKFSFLESNRKIKLVGKCKTYNTRCEGCVYMKEGDWIMDNANDMTGDLQGGSTHVTL